MSVLAASVAVVAHFQGKALPGWPSMVVVVMLFGGIQLFCLGMIGEYIARIYTEVQRRPLYEIVRNRPHRPAIFLDRGVDEAQTPALSSRISDGS